MMQDDEQNKDAMSDDTENANGASEEQVAQEAQAEEAQDAQGDEASPEQLTGDIPLDEILPETPSLEDQLADANDKLLRTLAELENTRRRAERDHGHPTF